MVSDSEEDVSLYDSELSESYYTDDDDDDDDYAGAESEDDDFYRPQKPYTALVEGDIRQRQDEEISHVSATLSVSTVAASLLLYHYKWNVSQLHDAWFGDEERVRATVGLLDTDSTPRKRDQEEELICGICFELCPWDQIYPTGCGHPYCKMCWKGYITASINDGPGCLSLRCPDPSCGAAVGQDMVDELASNEEKQKYSRFFLRSFIEEKKNTKWCPSPGCENAVEFEFGSSVYDVTCLCSCTFCWNCTEDAHRPVDCDTVAKWVLKNSSESENTDWIIANSKPCPKCKRPIEKDHGCMHMTCTQPCGFQFCWLCLGAWDDHDEKTGGFYACNKYEI